MADVAAGLLQARRCIHGVAEERDFHLDGAEFANDHGPAMKRGAEVCPEAEVANVGVGAFVQLLQRVEAGADAVPVPKAGGKWPGGNDLIANVFVDYAALRHDRSRDVTDEAVQKIEERVSGPRRRCGGHAD
jgi:hypothetical protein